MKEEQTLVIIKPDGLQKSLTGNILTKLSETKLRIVGAKVVRVTEERARAHYQHLLDEPFFNELKNYIMGNIHGENYQRVLVLAYKGKNAISKVRQLAGATNPEEANPTTIRGAYGRITTRGVYENVIHASANKAEAEREIKMWFKPEEIVDKIYKVKYNGELQWKKPYDKVEI